VGVNLTVKKTEERKNVRGDFIAQMHPSDCGDASTFFKARCVTISNTVGNDVFRVVAWLEQSSNYKAGEIRLDQKLRTAVGVTPEDTISVETISPPLNFWIRFWLNRLFGVQCNLARVMFAGNADMEINVSRVQRDLMGTIGIKEGDVIIVESPNTRMEIRSLELTERVTQEIGNKLKLRPEAKERFNNLRLNRLEAELDLPIITLDFDARELLALKPGDVVRVHRSIKHCIMQRIHLISTPLLITLLGSMALTDDTTLRAIFSGMLLLVFLLNFIELSMKTK